MLKSHGIALEIAKMEQRIEDLPEIRADQEDFETRFNEGQALQKDLIALFKGKDEATEQEDRDAQAAIRRDADTDGWDPELREQQQLLSRVSLMDVLRAATTDTFPGPETPFGEYRSHILAPSPEDRPGTFPLELLLPREGRMEMLPDELRAVTVLAANTNVNQASVAARIFGNGDAAYIGGRFVPASGAAATFPVITSTTLGVSIADGTDETIAAGTIALKRLVPLRIQRALEWYEREFLEGTGFEAALSTDLIQSIGAGLDNIAVDTTISELTAPTAPTTDADLADFIAAYAKAVDAKAARSIEEVRLLVGTRVYGHAFTTSVASIVTAYQLLPRDRFRASANIANAADSHAIAYRTGQGPSRLVIPVWRRAQLLRDPFTAAAGGIMRLWATMYANAGLLDEATHQQFTFQSPAP